MALATIATLPPPPPGKTGWPWTEGAPALPATAPGGRPWPRLSLITPSYNQGQFLEETLRSVLLQGYPDLEYIVVDGGSQDESAAIIAKYAPWLSFWVSERDHGQAEAINKGFARATGGLIGWLNSDDYLLPGSLARIAQAHLERPEAILLGDVELFTQDGTFAKVFEQKGVSFRAMVEVWSPGMFWSQPGTFIPLTAYKQVGGLDESLRFVFDRDWMCRLLRVAPVHYLRAPVARFRMHDASKTMAEARDWLPETVAVTERFWDEVPGLDKARALAEIELWFGAAPALSVIRLGRSWRRGVGHLGRAVGHSRGVLLSSRFWLLCAVAATPAPLLRLVRRYVKM